MSSITLDGVSFQDADFLGSGFYEDVTLGDGSIYPRWQAMMAAWLRDAGRALATTSITPITPATGSVTLTMAAAIPITPGASVLIADPAAPTTRWLFGVVTARTGASLTVNVTDFAGTAGSSWGVSVSGPKGPALSSPVPIAQGGHGQTTLAGAQAALQIQTPVPVRQTALAGVADSAGRAAFITTGSGLRPGLLATSAALVLAFAAGFSAIGPLDYVEAIAADSATFFPTLAANNLSFLYAERTAPGTVVGGATLAPPAYAYAYPRSQQSCLKLNNSGLDEFGNSWTASNLTYSNSSPAIAGTYMAVFNGTSSKIVSTDFTTLGTGGWTLRAKVKPAALPGSGSHAMVVNAAVSSGHGVFLSIYNNAGTIRFMYQLSSNGSSNDICAGIVGSTTPVVGTSYDLELTYDAVAGVYRLYVNGTQENSTVSAAKICAITGISIGIHRDGASYPLNGSLQAFEFLPYCTHPAGTTFTPPTALPDITVAGYASDWFDLANFKMKKVSAASSVAGTDPTFTAVNRVYLGEATTGAASVSSVVSYAFRGKYSSGWIACPGVSTRTTFSSNIGVPAGLQNCSVDGKVMTRDGTNLYPAGTIIKNLTSMYVGAYAATSPACMIESNNMCSVVSNSYGFGINYPYGAWNSFTRLQSLTDAFIQVYADRGF